jgi:hypothetical protein
MATTIDALGLAEDFEKAGFPRDQALGMARAIRDHSHETLASKADLHELELRLEVRFSQLEQRFLQLEQRLEQKIADVQIGLIKWFTGVMIAQAAAIVALIKLLPS